MSNSHIDTLIDSLEIKTNPLQAFDGLLVETRDAELGKTSIERLKKLVIRSILSIGGHSDLAVTGSDDDIEERALDILSKFHLMQNKDIVATCFMRLFPETQMKWATIPPWRPKVIDAIDIILKNEAYKEWKIDLSLQPHQKISLLSDIVLKQEKNLRDSLNALTSIETLNHQRQKLMLCLNNKTGRLLFRPFLPGNIEALLTDVYNSAQEYLRQKETLGVIDAYTNAIDTVEQVIENLQSFQTITSVTIAGNLRHQLIRLIENDFSRNKATQPASLILEARVKKYPLHNIGSKINIGLIVRNIGSGFSYETNLAITADNALDLNTSDILVGRLPPNESQVVTIPSDILMLSELVKLQAKLTWKNYDKTEKNSTTEVTIESQNSGINWNELAQIDPYSLEAVEIASQLVGRKDVLNRMLGSIKSSNIGSSIIHGQKRVGKTSIANVIQSQLEEAGYLTIYLEAGDYVTPSANATVNRLSNILCRKIVDKEPRALKIPIPTFDDALSPFTDFLDDLAKVAPERRIVIILDEFDRLPYDLYASGPWGDSFFLTLRSITSRPNVGFILIGAERMSYIIDKQGVQLNRWSMVPVDYFSRDNDWDDYKELIQRPVQGILEYTEDALLALHEYTSGNPYFTKLICQYVFRSSLNSRDCYITRLEVEIAIDKAIKEAGENAFQHFWEDRIFETGDKANEKSIRRRKILIAISDVLQRQSPASGQEILHHPLVKDMATLETDLKEFITRKVLVGKIAGRFEDHNYDFKVEFFRLWLKEKGIQDIIASFSDLDFALIERQKEEQLKIQSEEIVVLVEKWGTYKGQELTTDKARAWLDQFTDIQEQRVMFKILQKLHFYTNAHVRTKLKEIHSIVVRGLGGRYIELGKTKRSDILVSYMDGLSKSGAFMANLYADEAAIYSDNIVEKNKIIDVLKGRNDIKAIVFIDDFVGTGTQSSKNLEAMLNNLGQITSANNVKIIFVAIVAVKEGWNKLQETINKMNRQVESHYCDLLNEADLLFSENSEVLTDSTEREVAKVAALKYGKLIVKDNPLGYGNLGVAVVFERSCPNDTLPILWAEGSGVKWTPLFKRL